MAARWKWKWWIGAALVVVVAWMMLGLSHERAATAAQVVEDKTYEADRLIRRARPSP
jgi:hypothetical protein